MGDEDGRPHGNLKEKEQKTRFKVIVIVVLIIGLLVGGFLTDRFYQVKINKLEKDLDVGQVYKLIPIPLDHVDFQIIKHGEGIGTIHDQQTYWDGDYLIKVFRSGKTYYIKIYTEWEGLPE